MTSSVASPSVTLNSLEPAIIGNFSYIGCYLDLIDGNTRSLPDNIRVDSAMTLEMCALNCASYTYFGTEFQSECYCGYTLAPTLRATESDCNAPCLGNSSELCGSGARLSTYQNQNHIPPPPPPTHVAVTPINFQWLSCYTEGSASRALTGSSFATDLMTVESCTTFCAGYTYSGVEYGRECYCGDSLSAGAVPAPLTECNFLCKGNSSEYCGAGNRLDLYQFNPALASGAMPSSTGGFGIAAISSPVAVSSMALSTPSIPVSSAGASSQYSVLSSSSVEPSVPVTSEPSTKIPSTFSSTLSSSSQLLSSSNPTTLSTISVPKSTSTGPSSNPATTTTTSSTSIQTGTSQLSTPTPPSSYTHLGCFQDLQKHHVLPLLFSNSSVTPELCEAYVVSLANKPTPTILPYFAVEYHNECYGGSSLSFYQTSATSLYGRHACTDVCAGSMGAKSTGSAMCGGRKQFNLYATGDAVGFEAAFTKSV